MSLSTAAAEALVAEFPCVAFGTAIVLFVPPAIEVRPVIVTLVLLVRVNVTPAMEKRAASVPAKVKSVDASGAAFNVAPGKSRITLVVVVAVTYDGVVLVAAFAIGNGPTTPSKSDPTSTSNVEVLAVPKEEFLVRFDLKEFPRKRSKFIFEALTFDFRARIKEITRE